jgi:hypothetical protein
MKTTGDDVDNHPSASHRSRAVGDYLQFRPLIPTVYICNTKSSVIKKLQVSLGSARKQ